MTLQSVVVTLQSARGEPYNPFVVSLSNHKGAALRQAQGERGNSHQSNAVELLICNATLNYLRVMVNQVSVNLVPGLSETTGISGGGLLRNAQTGENHIPEGRHLGSGHIVAAFLGVGGKDEGVLDA